MKYLRRIRESTVTQVSSPVESELLTERRVVVSRSRRLLTVSALLGVALGVAGCTIPTTKDGKGYGPSDEFARQYGAAEPVVKTVELRSGAKAKLSTKNASWNPSRYVAAAGASVVLDVVNDDTGYHNFTFADLRLSKNLAPDAHALVRFKAPDPGRYRFYCKYHQQEMQGWLTVK
jgi:plastocyanin